MSGPLGDKSGIKKEIHFYFCEENQEGSTPESTVSVTFKGKRFYVVADDLKKHIKETTVKAWGDWKTLGSILGTLKAFFQVSLRWGDHDVEYLKAIDGRLPDALENTLTKVETEGNRQLGGGRSADSAAPRSGRHEAVFTAQQTAALGALRSTKKEIVSGAPNAGATQGTLYQAQNRAPSSVFLGGLERAAPELLSRKGTQIWQQQQPEAPRFADQQKQQPTAAGEGRPADSTAVPSKSLATIPVSRQEQPSGAPVTAGRDAAAEGGALGSDVSRLEESEERGSGQGSSIVDSDFSGAAARPSGAETAVVQQPSQQPEERVTARKELSPQEMSLAEEIFQAFESATNRTATKRGPDFDFFVKDLFEKTSPEEGVKVLKFQEQNLRKMVPGFSQALDAIINAKFAQEHPGYMAELSQKANVLMESVREAISHHGAAAALKESPIKGHLEHASTPGTPRHEAIGYLIAALHAMDDLPEELGLKGAVLEQRKAFDAALETTKSAVKHMDDCHASLGIAYRELRNAYLAVYPRGEHLVPEGNPLAVKSDILGTTDKTEVAYAKVTAADKKALQQAEAKYIDARIAFEDAEILSFVDPEKVTREDAEKAIQVVAEQLKLQDELGTDNPEVNANFLVEHVQDNGRQTLWSGGEDVAVAFGQLQAYNERSTALGTLLKENLDGMLEVLGQPAPDEPDRIRSVEYYLREAGKLVSNPRLLPAEMTAEDCVKLREVLGNLEKLEEQGRDVFAPTTGQEIDFNPILQAIALKEREAGNVDAARAEYDQTIVPSRVDIKGLTRVQIEQDLKTVAGALGFTSFEKKKLEVMVSNFISQENEEKIRGGGNLKTVDAYERLAAYDAHSTEVGEQFQSEFAEFRGILGQETPEAEEKLCLAEYYMTQLLDLVQHPEVLDKKFPKEINDEDYRKINRALDRLGDLIVKHMNQFLPAEQIPPEKKEDNPFVKAMQQKGEVYRQRLEKEARSKELSADVSALFEVLNKTSRLYLGQTLRDLEEKDFEKLSADEKFAYCQELLEACLAPGVDLKIVRALRKEPPLRQAFIKLALKMPQDFQDKVKEHFEKENVDHAVFESAKSKVEKAKVESQKLDTPFREFADTLTKMREYLHWNDKDQQLLLLAMNYSQEDFEKLSPLKKLRYCEDLLKAFGTDLTEEEWEKVESLAPTMRDKFTEFQRVTEGLRKALS